MKERLNPLNDFAFHKAMGENYDVKLLGPHCTK
jgi:hypothetical protein